MLDRGWNFVEGNFGLSEEKEVKPVWMISHGAEGAYILGLLDVEILGQ